VSDSTQGPGWWQAADGKWYSPEQHHDFQPAPTQPLETMSAPPVGPPPVGPSSGAPGAASSNAKWIVVGALAAAIVVIAAFLLLRGGDDKKSTVAANSSSSSSSSSASSSSSSSSSRSSGSASSSSSSSSSSAASSSSALSESAIRSRLLKAADIGPDYVDETFQSSEGKPTACGGPSVNSQVKPDLDVGADASGPTFFEEEVLVYKTAEDAKKALQLAKEGLSCPQPTIEGGGPVNFSEPKDVSSDVGRPVDEAIQIDVQTEEANGKFFAIRIGNVITSFQFAQQISADSSKLPDELKLVRLGLKRLNS
jgi:hypothetical protein